MKAIKNNIFKLINFCYKLLFGYPNKGENKFLTIKTNSSNGKVRNAAIFYVFQGVLLYSKDKWNDDSLNSHSMYWESVEMVKILNKYGYDVDYFDCTCTHLNLDLKKYDLIIDERNNVKNFAFDDQILIYYATGCHWLTNNQSEYGFIKDFADRNSIIVLPERQITPYDTDLYANYITYFGNDFQVNTFNHSKAKKIPLSISSTYEIQHIERDIEKAKYHFLWIGSRGAIHKGLHIVIDAFCQLPQFHLHIAAAIENEYEFMQWLNKKIESNANIHNEGWQNIGSNEFKKIAEKCLGSIYTSSAEGGAGSIVQLMHFGIIPFVNKTTALRGEHLGIVINGEKPSEQTQNIVENLLYFESLNSDLLQDWSNKITGFAKKHHTRKSYSESFEYLITQLQ
ncbi:MAG: hypothetical protein ACI9YE_000042 [Psychroserpens sp.]